MDTMTQKEAQVVESGFVPWPVSWSGIWVGALAALAVSLIIGLVAIAIGVHQMGSRGGPGWREAGFWSLVFAVLGSFLAFAVGAEVASRVAGIFRPETAMLHGVIVWLLALPFRARLERLPERS